MSCPAILETKGHYSLDQSWSLSTLSWPPTTKSGGYGWSPWPSRIAAYACLQVVVFSCW